jgi:crossover junction endodeoxyribonuclease RuvC
LPRINRGGRRWALAPGAAGPAGVTVRILGICYVVSGAIRTRGGSFAPRLRQIFDGVQELVRQYQPAEVAIERVFMHRNADSALKLGQARGAAICAAFAGAASLHEYAPREVKLAIVGQGGAQKEQVQLMVKSLLKLQGELGPDAADAIGLALCHAYSRGARQAVDASVALLEGRP